MSDSPRTSRAARQPARHHLVIVLCALAAAIGAFLLRPAPHAQAYIEMAYTLGKLVQDATNIVLVQVESVDKTKNTITYKKIEDLKGKHPQDIIKHNIAQGGFHPREWQNIMAWAQPGQYAVFFHNGSASETCINNYWYQCYPGGEWWNFYHAEPYLLRSYAGKPEKLAAAVKQMLAGQEVVVPAMVDGDKNALHLRTARVQRLKASLKIQDYDQKRDFVGWGGEELRPIAGMPGFTHYAPLTRVGLGATGAMAVDFNADGKTDFLIYSESRLALYQNEGGSFNEVIVPFDGGARAAAWADYNAAGSPSLLLATPAGPRLLTNLGGGKFRDDSAALPAQPYYNTTACAWIDFQGKPAILLADGFAGLRLYRNLTAVNDAPPNFVDISDAAGLGRNGVAGALKGDALLVADVNGDGKPDFLFCAGTGVLAINTGDKFVESRDPGFAFQTGRIRPALAKLSDALYLAVPQPGKVLLYKADAKGHFADVTPGVLAQVPGTPTCVAFCDFDNTGHLDLLVGCLRAPNRFFRNAGGGAFVDASAELGLDQKIYNTQALAVLDLNRDGTPDLLLNNEAQEPVLMLGNAARRQNRNPAEGVQP